MTLFWELLGSFTATLTFSLLLGVPRRAIWTAATLGLLGYALYRLAGGWSGSATLGYFVGTWVSTLLGEIAAKRMRMAATIFITPAILPLVPGLGLYRTMLLTTQGDLSGGSTIGVQTFLLIGTMALAIALSSITARLIKLPQKTSGN